MLLQVNCLPRKDSPNPKIFIDRPIDYDWNLLERSVNELEDAARNENFQAIYQIFRSLNIGYQRKDAKLAI